MKVGIPSETKVDEYRVSMTPAGVRELTEHGHEVLSRRAPARRAASPTPTTSRRARRSCRTPTRVFAGAEMIVKVKEPLDPEVARLRPGQILFTYLHLAPAPELTRALCDSGATAHRLRDRRGPPRPPAAARADVGDRRAPRDAGRRVHAREAARRPRRAARRRAGRRGRERDDHRRRQRRAQRRRGGDRDGRRRVHLRRLDRPPARARDRLRRTLLDGLLLDARDRGAAAAHRPRDRRGARRRRPRAVRDPPQPARR